MIGEGNPNMVTSCLSGTVNRRGGTIEVINQNVTSAVRNTSFVTGNPASVAFRRMVDDVGVRALSRLSSLLER